MFPFDDIDFFCQRVAGYLGGVSKLAAASSVEVAPVSVWILRTCWVEIISCSSSTASSCDLAGVNGAIRAEDIYEYHSGRAILCRRVRFISAYEEGTRG
ncbi:hypothetical protein Y032_0173g390 [Ancylostoma ceylanicum]|uniref:Uncharacterized protein n=1 Tax=Ancylostoma ceylanicum TaxID=53326 RepID=A0A016SV42_9BILA|nr:hypothetical protein Y032_0173g390 [Ancylostoma ceylanicum]